MGQGLGDFCCLIKSGDSICFVDLYCALLVSIISLLRRMYLRRSLFVMCVYVNRQAMLACDIHALSLRASFFKLLAWSVGSWRPSSLEHVCVQGVAPKALVCGKVVARSLLSTRHDNETSKSYP